MEFLNKSWIKHGKIKLCIKKYQEKIKKLPGLTTREQLKSNERHIGFIRKKN